MWNFLINLKKKPKTECKKTTLKKLFKKKDCWGWAWPCKGKPGYYVFHNDNDLGLLSDIDDCDGTEIILRKIEIYKKNYVYILRNSWGIDEECDSCGTEKYMLAELYWCHFSCLPGMPLTEEQKKYLIKTEIASESKIEDELRLDKIRWGEREEKSDE